MKNNQNIYTISIVKNFGNLISFSLQKRSLIIIIAFFALSYILFICFTFFYFIDFNQVHSNKDKQNKLVQENIILKDKHLLLNEINYFDLDYKITLDQENNIYLFTLVKSQNKDEAHNLLMLKFSAEKNLLLKQNYQIGNIFKLVEVESTVEGLIYVTGIGYAQDQLQQNNRNKNIFLIKLDKTGKIVANITISSNESDILTGVALDKDDNIFLTGFTKGNLFKQPSKGLDSFVMSLHEQQETTWQKEISLNEFIPASHPINNYHQFTQEIAAKKQILFQKTKNVKNQPQFEIKSVKIAEDMSLQNIYISLKKDIIQTGYTFINNRPQKKESLYVSFVLVNNHQEPIRYRSVNRAKLDKNGKPLHHESVTKYLQNTKSKKYSRELRLQDNNEYYNEIHFQFYNAQGVVIKYEIIEIDENIFFEN